MNPKHKPWTHDLVKELKRLNKTRLPVKKIAKQMKRTEGAIRQKMFSVGLSR
jgi:hypothetical protein